MFVEGLHMPAVSGIPTGKSPGESGQENVEVNLRHRLTKLFGTRIPRRRIALHLL